MSLRLNVSIGQFSDKGRNESNRDFYATLVPDEDDLKTKGICCAIADGMDSDEFSARSSEQCVKAFLSDYYSTPDNWSVKKSGSVVLNSINSWLLAQTRNECSQSMVSTFSALILRSTTASIFHVGDSRIYRLRENEFECLTNDHRISLAQGERCLSRAMGIDDRLGIDYRALALQPGDIFLMTTTNGVHDYLSIGQLKQNLLAEHSSLDQIARNIVEQTVAAGSRDYVSIQLVRIDAIPPPEVQEVFSDMSSLPFPPALTKRMVLDGYEILQLLHRGSKTTFYKVLDQVSGLIRVMKVPSLLYKNDEIFIQQFCQEEWIGKKIDNPYVVKIFEPGRRRHFLYIIMEMINGGISLREWITLNPRPEEDTVIEITEQMIAGISALHQLEMWHGALTPENIIINAQQDIRLTALDAVVLSGMQESTSGLDHARFPVDIKYTAVEYFLGLAADKRAQIFSVGVMVYEMLTGRLPYGELALADINWVNLKGLRYQLAVNFNPTLARWRDGALEKAVQLDAQARYENFSEFLSDLQKPNPDLIHPPSSVPVKDSAMKCGFQLRVLFLINFILLFWLLAVKS